MKSCHNRSLNVVWRICAAAILCVAAGASAQSVHKEVDIDGRITFTDRPETTPLPRAATESDPDVASASTPARNSLLTSMSAATVDFNEATRRLVRARQSRQEGLEPRLGENTDDAGVRMMNERYLRDRQGLDREVVAAQRRSNETLLVRSALLRNDHRTDPLKQAQP